MCHIQQATRRKTIDTCLHECLAYSFPQLQGSCHFLAASPNFLPAMSASLERSVVASAEARIMQTFAGSRWRKSSLRKALLSGVVPRWSPSSCCLRRRSWVGLRSPSSSPLMSCCSFLCSDAAVRFIYSSVLSVS